MSLSPDRAEFFVREAGEYLARMTPLLAGSALTSPDEFVRLARALRGATLMAGPPGLIRAATAFENAAKALQGGTLSWQEPVREGVCSARASLDSLVSRTSAWGEEERKAVSRLAHALEVLLGPSAAASSPRSPLLTPAESTPEGVRTFVMREAARIARSTEDLLRTAEQPTAEALRGVLDRMHAIRGLALPGQFRALTLVLESLESLLGDLLRGYPPPPTLGPILTAATLGLLRGAEGQTGDELPADVARLGELACAAFAEERDVVPVEELLLDPAPPMMRGETDPLPPPDPVDLVSLGDRLRHLASQLRTPDRTVLPFHVQSLAAMLRSLRTIADRDPAGPAIREIARAIRRGGALADPEGFASALLALAQPLTAANSVTAEDVARDLALAVMLLPGAPVEGAPPSRESDMPAAAMAVVAPPREEDPGTTRPEEEEEEEAGIVPIASLLLPPDPAARTPFEVSFCTLHRLRHGLDQVTPPGTSDPPVFPADPSAPADETIVPIESLLHPEESIVPIEELLYRGSGAAGRLREIQVTLRTLRSPAPDPETLSALLDECLDLLPLATDLAH